MANEYGEVFEGFQTRPVLNERLEISISWSEMLDTYIATLYSEVERINPYMELPFSLDEFKRYAKTLIVVRVWKVRDEKDYRKRLLGDLAVPVLLYQLLVKIGIVELQEYGLTVIPSIDTSTGSNFDAQRLMDKDELLHMSGLITSFTRFGLAATDKGPTSREGDPSFMAGLVYGENVVSMANKSGSALTGFLIAMAENSLTNDYFYAMYRTWYGPKLAFRMKVERLTALSNKMEL